jgi:hypothetical protein
MMGSIDPLANIEEEVEEVEEVGEVEEVEETEEAPSIRGLAILFGEQGWSVQELGECGPLTREELFDFAWDYIGGILSSRFSGSSESK